MPSSRIRRPQSFPIFAICVGLLGGCAATPVPVRVVDLAAFDDVARGRDIVLYCTVSGIESRPNYTFAENVLGPAPYPGRLGFLARLTLRIEAVDRGSFEGSELVIDHARAVDADGDASTRPTIAAFGGHRRPIRLAFDRDWLRRRHGFVLARADAD